MTTTRAAALALAILTFAAAPAARAQFIKSIFDVDQFSGSAHPITITSDVMDIEMKKNLITLTGNVDIDEERTHMSADKMVLQLKEGGANSEMNKDVKTIVAEGDVKIRKKPLSEEEKKKGERRAEAGKIVYNVESGEIRLMDQPVLYQGKSTIRGHEIIIWRDNDHMRVLSGADAESEIKVVPESGGGGL